MKALIQKQQDKGFSAVELIVVMAILGILSAIAVPIYLNQRNDGYKSSVRTDIANVSTALLMTKMGDVYATTLPPDVKITKNVKLAMVRSSDGKTICVEGRHTSVEGFVASIKPGKDAENSACIVKSGDVRIALS